MQDKIRENGERLNKISKKNRYSRFFFKTGGQMRKEKMISGWKRLSEDARAYLMRMGLKKKTILFALGTFAGAVLLTFFIFGIAYGRMWKQSMIAHLENVGEEKENDIYEYFINMDDLAYNICYSNWIQDLFQNRVSILRRQEQEENAQEFLSSLCTLYDGNQIAVIALNGTRICGSYGYRLDYDMDITEKEWYPQLLKDGKYVETGSDKGIYRNLPGWCMNLYYVVNDYNTLDMAGIMVITIPVENIGRLLDTGYDEIGFALCEKGEMIASSLSEELTELPEADRGYIRKTAGRYYVTRSALKPDGFQWELITALDTENQKIDSFMLISILVGMLLILGCLLITAAMAVSRYLTRPILSCAGAMLEIRNNHMGIQIDNGYTDEIGELIGGFNEMSSSLYTLIEKNKLIVALQKEAEIRMLERQINPHFLFNTLEIINSLIMGKKEKFAMKVCETLGQLYRYNLRQDKWITLREELDYTRQYLMIMRYKINELTWFYEIDEELKEIPFMKAILQPLVENSIMHGFRKKTQECCISIEIRERENGVFLEVMDNGEGMEEEQLEVLQMELSRIREKPMEKITDTVHIGIRNVVQRLHLEYGEAFRFRITSNAGYGTRIEMTIPKESISEGQYV